MQRNEKLLAVYAYLDDVVAAIGRMKDEKIAVETVYSPAPAHAIDRALGKKPSPVRRFVLFGAVFGIVFGTSLAVYAATRWNLLVWGKAPVSIVPYVVVAFEFCVLFAVITGVLGFLFLARMPKYATPLHFDPRFTVDRFGLLLTCPAGRRDTIAALLREAGAEEVRDAGI